MAQQCSKCGTFLRPSQSGESRRQVDKHVCFEEKSVPTKSKTDESGKRVSKARKSTKSGAGKDMGDAQAGEDT